MKKDLYSLSSAKQRVSACYTGFPVFPAYAIRFVRASLSRLDVILSPRLVFRQGHVTAEAVK